MMPTRRLFHEKRRLLWPLAIALLINLALLALVVYPLSQKVDGGEQDAAVSTAALNVAVRDHAAAKATVAGKSQADAELQKFYGDVLPADLSGARRITFLHIEQLANQNDLRIERQSSEPKVQRESQLVKFTYSASLSGEYRNVRRFIHALETAPEFLVLENVDVSKSDAETRGLSVSVQIATYFRTGGNGN